MAKVFLAASQHLYIITILRIPEKRLRYSRLGDNLGYNPATNADTAIIQHHRLTSGNSSLRILEL